MQISVRRATTGTSSWGSRTRLRAAGAVPRQEELDAFPDIPTPFHDELRSLGLGGWWLPERYGGAGLGLEESVDLVSELAYGDAGFAFTEFISILGTTTFSLYGSEDTRSAISDGGRRQLLRHRRQRARGRQRADQDHHDGRAQRG